MTPQEREVMKLARQLLWRYRHETPMGNQPHMICQEVDEVFERIDEALAQPDQYAKGYADAMNWKTANHLEHLPAAHVDANDISSERVDKTDENVHEQEQELCPSCRNGSIYACTCTFKPSPRLHEQPKFDYKEHAEGLQRDYDLLLAEYNALKNHQEMEPVATVISETGADIKMSWWHEPALPIGTKLYTSQQLVLAWTQKHWTEYEYNIAAAEREACAKICDSWGMGEAESAAYEIRARGKE